MLRWMPLLLLMTMLMAEELTPATDEAISTDTPQPAQPLAAPEIRFRYLEWWVPDCEGRFGWHPGEDLTPIPSVMGRIEALKITGTQELVWEHAYFRVQSVMRGEGCWFLGFEKGTLKLTHIEHQRWQVEFTPAGGSRPTRIFRTARLKYGSFDPP
jgi:hypothetical protein